MSALGRLLAVAGALAATVAALAGAAPAQATPTALEPIAVRHLPVPDGITGMSEPDWLPDGRRLVVVFTSPDQEGDQLGVIRRDGGGLRCLTCGLDPTEITGPPPDDRPVGFGKPVAFSDGERVLMRLGIQPGQPGAETQNFVYAILECAPSLADCEQRELVPLLLPGGGIAQGVQNREGRVSPDGRWFAWTELSATGARMSIGRLVRGDDSYSLSGVRILNPDVPLDDDSRNWRAASPSFEFKNFSADGRHAFYSSMYDAENFDTWRVDLKTGERERLTRQIEWDEDVSDSPGDGSLSQYTSRGFGRMVALAQVPRPPFVDSMLFTWTGRFMLNLENRHCLLEPWLMPPGGERGRFFGQPVNPDLEGPWDSRTLGAWSPDGTRLAFWESRYGAVAGDDEPTRRVTIARLASRRPAQHPASRTPTPRWAPKRADFAGYQSHTGTFVVAGRESGTATVTLSGTIFSGAETVTYENYSDDGRTFLDGTESVDEPSILGSADWEADLKVSGRHHGVLKADIGFVTGGLASGTIESRLDGRRRSALPPPTCEPLRVPRLRVASANAGRKLKVTVRSRITGDPVLRPVAGAAVSLGGREAETDGRGVATVRRSPGTIRATAAGFRPAEAG